MLLKKLVLENFGVYGETNEFDFTTTREKPIILIGGINGAGKTTLFESILLCLYGQDSFDNKVTKKQYHDMILRSFHRELGTKKASSTSSVAVEFEYAHQGEVFVYQVQRIWQNTNGAVEEEFSVKKKKPQEENFSDLDYIETSEWQMFINQLIPKGIAKLFFFDGEKIQHIAEEGNEDEYIRASFDTLLGLDIVNQLDRDLKYALERISQESETKKLEEKLESAQKERDKLSNQLENTMIRESEVRREIDNLQQRIRTKEEKFEKLGGKFYERRAEVYESKLLHESELQRIEKDIRDLCGDILPFSLVPEQLETLKKEIQSDKKKIQASFEKDILQKHFADILEHVKSDKFLSKSNTDTKNTVEKQLSNLLDAKLTKTSFTTPPMFDFSLQHMEQMLAVLDEVKVSGKSKIEILAKQFNSEIDKIKRLNTELESVPKDNEIGPLRSEINQLNREIGHLEEKLDELKVLESKYRHYLNKENKVLRNGVSQKASENRLQSSLDLGPKVQSVLYEYSEQLRDKKLEHLERYVLDGIKMLFHKKDFIDGVKINRETFEVTLFKKDDEITKNMLSKGELQMFATSVVWGLAKTSGRPLPFMIDTPLARLDDEHRINLVESFFPFASHQIIIFSTNSEINKDLYQKLTPFIANSFVIEFDSAKGKTIQHDGYFFDKIGETLIEV